jgi:hypothetical protein
MNVLKSCDSDLPTLKRAGEYERGARRWRREKGAIVDEEVEEEGRLSVA